MSNTTKQCTKCGEVKPLSEYHKKLDGKYGVQVRCKECRCKQKRDRYANDSAYREAYLKQRTDRYANRKGTPAYILYIHINSMIQDYSKKAGMTQAKYTSKVICEGDQYIDILLGGRFGLPRLELPQLIARLESLFLPEMTWENYGKGKDKLWQFGHDIARTSIKDLLNPEEAYTLLHCSNMFPVLIEDNHKQGTKTLSECDKELQDKYLMPLIETQAKGSGILV